MKEKTKFYIAAGILATFVLWTTAIKCIDVQAIGPQGSTVGFATLNGFFHELTGVHISLYIITDWLSLAPMGFIMGFALLGLTQWLKRKSLRNVDASILILGGFYIVVMIFYLLFEILVVNYRPILINGHLEASYPSSTTMLVMCVMPTAMLQLHGRIKNTTLRRWVFIAITVFTAFMVMGRLLSGVHWLTDIIGGALLSAGLVMLYCAITDIVSKRCAPDDTPSP